jgi:GNAT superfamily N-acetyltransferase
VTPAPVICHWRWELTSDEILRGHIVSTGVPGPAPSSALTKPFACDVQPLPGSALQYQLALSHSAKSKEARALRIEHPELPDSGDDRCGVLVLDANKRIVGAYLALGVSWTQALIVHPEHRGTGLARAMFIAWCKQTKLPMTHAKQVMNYGSLRSFLSAHRALVRWAIEEGKDVPEHVVRSIALGAKTAGARRAT